MASQNSSTSSPRPFSIMATPPSQPPSSFSPWVSASLPKPSPAAPVYNPGVFRPWVQPAPVVSRPFINDQTLAAATAPVSSWPQAPVLDDPLRSSASESSSSSTAGTLYSPAPGHANHPPPMESTSSYFSSSTPSSVRLRTTTPLYFGLGPPQIDFAIRENLPPPPAILKDPRSLLRDNDHDMLRRISQSRLSESTKKRRSGKGIEKFQEWLQLRFKNDHYDMTPYLHRISDGTMLEHSLRAVFIALFAKWVEFDLKTDPNVAISALKDDFLAAGTDTIIFDSDILKDARKRLLQDSRDPREVVLDRFANQKQAISIDMISRAIPQYLPSDFDWSTITPSVFHGMMALTAGVFMFNWGQRPSNMAVSTSRRAASAAAERRIVEENINRDHALDNLRERLYQGHSLRANEVFFWFENQWVASFYWSNNPTFPKIPEKMRLLMLTSKTKVAGYPDQFLVRADNSPGERELIRMASDIAFHTNYGSLTDSFFSRPHASNPNGPRVNLQTADIGRMAKAIAVNEGLDPALFSAKSFKIGFVSQLDAAGATPAQRTSATLHKTTSANDHYVRKTAAHEHGALAATADKDVTQYSISDVTDRSSMIAVARNSSSSSPLPPLLPPHTSSSASLSQVPSSPIDTNDPFRDFDIVRDSHYVYDLHDALPNLPEEQWLDQCSEHSSLHSAVLAPPEVQRRPRITKNSKKASKAVGQKRQRAAKKPIPQPRTSVPFNSPDDRAPTPPPTLPEVVVASDSPVPAKRAKTPSISDRITRSARATSGVSSVLDPTALGGPEPNRGSEDI